MFFSKEQYDGKKVTSMCFMLDFLKSQTLGVIIVTVGVAVSLNQLFNGILRDTKYQESTKSHFLVQLLVIMFFPH